MHKSGATSGSLSRVLPVITFDRDMIRLLNERLSSNPFSLQGLKRAFGILEQQFQDVSSTDNEPSITLEFSRSTLLDNYRATNDLLTVENRQGAHRNLNNALTTLLNNSPPDTDSLLVENSGVGRVNVFIARIRAEFKSMCRNPGDSLILDALDSNLHRVVCDFF